jgi:hypothetical protein
MVSDMLGDLKTQAIALAAIGTGFASSHSRTHALVTPVEVVMPEKASLISRRPENS